MIKNELYFCFYTIGQRTFVNVELRSAVCYARPDLKNHDAFWNHILLMADESSSLMAKVSKSHNCVNGELPCPLSSLHKLSKRVTRYYKI